MRPPEHRRRSPPEAGPLRPAATATRLPGAARGRSIGPVGETWRTERLVLRRFTAADEDALVELNSDPEVMRFLTGGRPGSRQAVRTRTLPQFLAYPPNVLGVWAATTEDGDFLGWLCLRQTPTDPELGYRFRRAAWGHGYATEGCRAIVDRAFEETGTRRIWAATMAVNIRSRRVLERVGLRHVRTYHEHFDDPIPGTELGEVEYAVTRSEWLARSPRPG